MEDFEQQNNTVQLKRTPSIGFIEFDEPDENLTISENLLAGGFAGMISEIATHPLDTVNTRLKMQITPPYKYNGFLDCSKTILREEKIRGFYGGVGASIWGALPSSALYFGTYEFIKNMGRNNLDEDYWPAVHFVAGAMSELSSSIVYVPFEVVRTRLQLGSNPNLVTNGFIKNESNYRNTVNALVSIGAREGIRGLYAGYWSCIILDCVYSAFQFLIYEQVKVVYRWISGEELGITLSLSAGVFAGIGASIISNPMDVVTTRLMAQSNKESAVLEGRSYKGIIHCLKQTIKMEGWKGLWKGTTARMLLTVPQSAIALATFEQLKTNFLAEKEKSLKESKMNLNTNP